MTKWRKFQEKHAKNHHDRVKASREKFSHIKRVAKIARLHTNITKHQMTAIEKLREHWIEVILEKPIANDYSFYLIDLYIPQHKICIEIDGDVHNNKSMKEADEIRDAYLRSKWYWVLRFKNEEVYSWFAQRVKKAMKYRDHIERLRIASQEKLA